MRMGAISKAVAVLALAVTVSAKSSLLQVKSDVNKLTMDATTIHFVHPKGEAHVNWGLTIPEGAEGEACGEGDSCLDFGVAKVVVTAEDHCQKVSWTTTSLTELKDCVAIEGHWYGGGEQISQPWPLEKVPRPETPFVTADMLQKRAQWYGGVSEAYWISSQGVAVRVEESTPLFLSVPDHDNDTIADELCLGARHEAPFAAPPSAPLALEYYLCSGDDVRQVHELTFPKFFSLPMGVPDERMLRDPIWSTWAQFHTQVNESKVFDFAMEVKGRGFNNSQIEIDDNWETCYGDAVFNPDRFPDPKRLFDDLKKEGYRVTLWIHPFINDDCESYAYADERGYFVKVVRILHQICSRGHRGVRVYLRSKDGDLRKAAASGGPPDPVLANTPQLFLSSAIQELLTLLFDPKIMKEDELWLAGKENINEYVAGGEKPSVPQGYGASAVSGKYEGFGSSPVKQGDSLVTQVRGMVERVITHTGDSKGVSADFLQGEKGDYQPIFLPSLGASVPSPQQSLHQSHLPGLTSGQLRKFKAHRSGRAGGGWDSDEEGQDTPPSPLSSNVDFSLPLPEHHSTEEVSAGAAEEDYITKILYSASWPADPDQLIISCRESASFDLNVFFEKVTAKFTELCDVRTRSSDSAEDKARVEDTPTQSRDLASCKPDNVTVQLLMLLLLIEFGIHYDIYAPNIANTHLRKTFQTISTSKNIDSRAQTKAKKLLLILEKLQ